MAEWLGRGLQLPVQRFESVRDLPAYTQNLSLGGEIGRRVGLKNQWQQCRMGSTPIPGTTNPYS